MKSREGERKECAKQTELPMEVWQQVGDSPTIGTKQSLERQGQGSSSDLQTSSLGMSYGLCQDRAKRPSSVSIRGVDWGAFG